MSRSLKPAVTLVSALIVAVCMVGQAQEPREVTGTWTAELRNGRVFLQVRTTAPNSWNSWSGDWNMGQTFPIEEFSGLPANDEHFTASNLKFELHREAGILSFEGAFRDARGAGRQLRVVVDRHGRQAEPRAAARDGDAGAIDRDLDGLVRQRLGDVGEQPAGHQGAAAVGDGRRNPDRG